MKSEEKLRSEAAAILGRIGGRSASGNKKRRTKAHYQGMQKKSLETKRARKSFGTSD